MPLSAQSSCVQTKLPGSLYGQQHGAAHKEPFMKDTRHDKRIVYLSYIKQSLRSALYLCALLCLVGLEHIRSRGVMLVPVLQRLLTYVRNSISTCSVFSEHLCRHTSTHTGATIRTYAQDKVTCWTGITPCKFFPPTAL